MREILFRGKRVDYGEWVDIPEYDGFYQANTKGEIRSVDRYVNHWRGGKCIKQGSILKQHLSHKGYLMVHLSINGNGGLVSVHRVIAKTFIPNMGNKPQVNHINGIKTDNRIDNLEWCDNYENQRHAFKTGLNKGSMMGRKGELHPRNLLSNLDIEHIIELKNNGLNISDISSKYNVSDKTIYRKIKKYERNFN